MCMPWDMWRSENSFQELVLSLCSAFWALTQTAKTLWQVFLPIKSYRRPLYAFFCPFFFLIVHSACIHVIPLNMSITVNMPV